MRTVFILLGLFLLLSCYQENHYYNTKEYTEKTDSLQKRIEELESLIEVKRTPEKQPKEEEVKIPTKPKIKEKKVIPKKIVQEKDTNTIFFKNGGISVTYGIKRDSRQLIRIYDGKGNILFKFENIQLSYQVNTTLSFRENNSVKAAETSMNPGASMYWYETYYTFDTDNQPLTKIEKRLPSMTIEDAMGEKYFWNKNTKKWIKQEIIIETNPIPSQ